MCEIKKMLFSVSAQGNPMAQIWVDDADVTKTSESIYIALAHQVAYLFFLGVGSKITLTKNNKGYYKVDVPDFFTNLFEGYKTNPNETIKIVGNMLNMAFKNTFNSIEFLKNGEIVKISQEEADEKCVEYLNGYTTLYQTAQNFLSNSKVKALKSVGKLLDKEDSKAGDVKEANAIVMSYVNLLAKDVISKNNFLIEEKQDEPVAETEEKPKTTKAKKSTKKTEDEEVPF